MPLRKFEQLAFFPVTRLRQIRLAVIEVFISSFRETEPRKLSRICAEHARHGLLDKLSFLIFGFLPVPGSERLTISNAIHRGIHPVPSLLTYTAFVNHR